MYTSFVSNPFVNVSSYLQNPSLRKFSTNNFMNQYNSSNQYSYNSDNDPLLMNSFTQNMYSPISNNYNKVKRLQSNQQTAVTFQFQDSYVQNDLNNSKQILLKNQVNQGVTKNNLLKLKNAHSLQIQNFQSSLTSHQKNICFSQHYQLNPEYKNTEILIEQFNQNELEDNQQQNQIDKNGSNFQTFHKVKLQSIKQMSQQGNDQVNSLKNTLNFKEKQKKSGLLQKIGKTIKQNKINNKNNAIVQSNQSKFNLKQFKLNLSNKSNQKTYVLKLRSSNNSSQEKIINPQILSQHIQSLIKPLLQQLKFDIFQKLDRIQQKINKDQKQSQKIIDQSAVLINVLSFANRGLTSSDPTNQNLNKSEKDKDKDIPHFVTKMKRTQSIQENQFSVSNNTQDQIQQFTSNNK